MAELLLKVGDRSSREDDYKDGDILCAFNDRAIKCVHAQHICHIKQAKRNTSGLILLTEHSRDWFENTHEYRFERVSATEIKRVNLITLEEEVFSDKPNDKGEVIDVRLFISRRKSKQHHYLFGEDGAEIWYGGKIDVSEDKLNIVWSAIETKTPNRRNQFVRWPMGNLDVRHHLPIAVDNFNDEESEALVISEIDDTDENNHIIIKKRKNKVDWQNSLQLTQRRKQDVLDRNIEVDLRESRQYSRGTIVSVKQVARIR